MIFCWKGKVADTAGVSDNSEFLIPEGIQRFHFWRRALCSWRHHVAGGLRSGIADKSPAKPPQKNSRSVARWILSLTIQWLKLVNNTIKWACCRRIRWANFYEPRILNIYLSDNTNNVVSGKERTSFDSDNNTMENAREVTLKLIGANFNRRNEYWLILEDAQTETGYQKYPVIIDLAFGMISSKVRRYTNPSWFTCFRRIRRGNCSEGYDLDALLNQHFAGRVVRKDLTKTTQGRANVLVCMCWASARHVLRLWRWRWVEQGLQNVKRILADNHVRPMKQRKWSRWSASVVRTKSSIKVGEAKPEKDVYEAQLSNLGIKDALVPSQMVKDNEKLLTGGYLAWLPSTISKKGRRPRPSHWWRFKPIQMPNMDMEEVFDARKHFNRDQWIDVLLRSVGMEPIILSNAPNTTLSPRWSRSWRTTITFASWGRAAVKAMYKEVFS